MKYTVRTSVIDVIGRIWMPSTVAATTLTLSGYDVENARDDDGAITRESVEDWLNKNAGDFAEIIDFAASIEDGDATVLIDWSDDESLLIFGDLMYPAED